MDSSMSQPLSTLMIFEKIKSKLGIRTDAELAAKLSISPQALSQAKKKGMLPQKMEKKLCEILDVSSLECVNELRGAINFVNVPFVTATPSASESGPAGTSFSFSREWLGEKGNPDQMFLMRISGDSMMPLIHHRDLVLVDQSQTDIVTPYELYAIGMQGAVSIKQVTPIQGPALQLRCYNPEYPAMNVRLDGDSGDGIRIVGKAVWFCHDF